MATTVNRILSNPQQRRAVESKLAAKGAKGDTMLAHITPHEAGILRRFGGSGTRNPKTGLLQFSPTDHSAAGNGDGSGGMGSGPNHGSGGSPVDHNPADNGGLSGGGGYGNASDGHSSEGSGAGAGGGHTGNNYQSQQYGVTPTVPMAPQPPAPPPPGVGLPSAVPIPTTALMSQNPGNLVGNAFGPLPAWATQSYQIGTAPTSYPVPGQTVPGQPPVTQPPVVQPPPTGGGNGGIVGGNGGGGQFGGGGGFGNGTGSVGQPGAGYNQNGGLGPQGIGNISNQAFLDVLHANGIGLGDHPVTHQTPGFASMPGVAGPSALLATQPNGQTNAQMAASRLLGIAPKPAPAPVPVPVKAPPKTGQTAAQLSAAQKLKGGILTRPAKKPVTPILSYRGNA